MHQQKYHIVGVMSGTSLDGIDLAEVEFSANEKEDGKSISWKFKILQAETVPYSPFWKKELQAAFAYSKHKLEKLDFKFTEKLADEINSFIRRNNIQSIDAVCSHGHTIFHQPDKGFTYQIGNLPRLAQLISQKVVCDFRVQDVALGGQGAPLVPIGDELLFSEYDYCLNLGGFANLSYQANGQRIAYDVCPVNIVLNHYAEKFGSDFDEDGKLARSGVLDLELLQKLNSLSYYSQGPPKSLGLEWVKKEIFPLLMESNLSDVDVLRTFTEHVAMTLSRQFRASTSVLITGGGAYNSFLIERLKSLSKVQIEIPPADLVEYKEAVVFALLGVLRLRGEINCLSSVTGAEKDHSTGSVYTP